MSNSGKEPGSFDQASWERRWSTVLENGGHSVDDRPPNHLLLGELSSLRPGRALDAGAGHGAETLWLAERGWEVTAVDFSATVLDYARSRAAAQGPEIAGRINWIQGDLGVWTPVTGRFDLVISLHVHVAGSVLEFVKRLASGVSVGGNLVMIGHQSADTGAGDRNGGSGQTQVRGRDVVDALDPERWEILTVDVRPRNRAIDGTDEIVHARRLK